MEKRNSRFADLDFLASGEFLEKNQTFFKELENDPRVIYFFEESDRGTNFDLLEVNVENAIPVPVLFEILGMEWDEEIALDEVVASIEERGIRIVAILDREVWDDEQRRRREEEEAKKWAKIDCRKECRAVDRFYNDTFSHWCSTVANNHRCAGGAFWCVSKEMAETPAPERVGISNTVLDPKGDRNFWDCKVPEEARENARIMEVKPGDNWVCPHRKKWHAKNRVSSVVFPLPGGYAQIYDNYGLAKAVIGPDGRLTIEKTINLSPIPFPEDDSAGIVYPILTGNEHGCGSFLGGRNLLERFIMLSSFTINKVVEDYPWLSREIGGQESDEFKKLAHSAGLVEYPDMGTVSHDLMIEYAGRFRRIVREGNAVLEWKNSRGHWGENNMEQVTYTCFAGLVTLNLPQLFKLYPQLEKTMLDSLSVALKYVSAHRPYGAWSYRNFRLEDGNWIADKYDPKETVPIGAEKDFILVSLGKEGQESEFAKNLTQLSKEIYSPRFIMWADIKKALVDGDPAYPSASFGREVLLPVPEEGQAKNFIFQVNIDNTDACVCGITLKNEGGKMVFTRYKGPLRYEAYRRGYGCDVLKKS